MTDPKRVPLVDYCPMSETEMRERAAAFLREMRRRRSVRAFSGKSAPRDVVADCIRAAATAPSGANMQPWRFVAVEDPAVKRRIREASEKTEREFYEKRATPEFIEAVSPLEVDADKPFLETASHLIVIFMQQYGRSADGERVRHYYPLESTAIAAGLLITAVHNVGLVALPYTPKPMRFLNEILQRPDNERAILILAVGYPIENAEVPDIRRKPFEEIASFV